MMSASLLPILLSLSTLLLSLLFTGSLALSPPRFTKVPTNMIGVSGGVVSFICQATGDPKPRVTWNAEGIKIEFDEGAGAVLRIQSLRAPQDESIYECVAVNSKGKISVQAKLSIIREDLLPFGFPNIDIGLQLKAMERPRMRTATMLCTASGNPNPEITWFKDFLPIDNSTSNGRIKQLSSGALQIENTKETDQGRYECVASNVEGIRQSSAINLYVQVRRMPPRVIIMPPTTQEIMDTSKSPIKEGLTSIQASEPMEVAALGRPLYLGMLYNCYKDSFIPGVTLWDQKSLSKNLDIRQQTQTYLKYSSSDTLSSKSSLLDVSASLKASFLGGLVEVEGSAKFLHDTKSSKQQSRVTMIYSETTRYEQLTMSQLGHFTYPEVFDQKTATHVVTAVLYGAQAVMVFDQTFTEEENEQEIEGELHVMVKNIPSFSIDGKGSVNMTEGEKKKAEKITCTFHGDVLLEQNPTTYTEAIQTYKKLPTLLKENPQNGVPIKVWLHPLHLLDNKPAQLKREITTSLISNIEDITEVLAEAQRTCNDLFIKTVLDSIFSDNKERLQLFQKSLSLYKTMLLGAIGRVLPHIRRGEMEEKSLNNIVNIHMSSPFNADMLKHWLSEAKSELDLLSDLTKSLEGISTEDSNALIAYYFNPDVDFVVSLTLTSLTYEDAYLSDLKKFLKSDRLKELNESNTFSVKPVRKWFSDPKVIGNMIDNVSQFRKFAEANKDNKRIRFIISAILNPSIKGSSIYLYENGRLTETQFKPMSKPPPPIVRNILVQAVSLRLNTSSSRDRVLHRVEYKQVKTPGAGAEEPWSFIDTYEEDYTLTGLESGKHYLIRNRIVGKVGVSEPSDTVSAIISATVSTYNLRTVLHFDGFFTIMKAMTWSDSREFCRRHGGDLVIIKSKEKQRLISSFAKEIGLSVWIGLSDIEKKGNMKWVDDSRMNQGFWREGEPNDYNGNEDCIVMTASTILENWNDIPCSQQSNFICEQKG